MKYKNFDLRIKDRVRSLCTVAVSRHLDHIYIHLKAAEAFSNSQFVFDTAIGTIYTCRDTNDYRFESSTI